MTTFDFNYIQFVEPEKAEIEDFAWQVCRNLSEHVSEDFADAAVVHGLSEVLQVAIQIGAKLLSDTLNQALEVQLQELQEAIDNGEFSDEETVSYSA